EELLLVAAPFLDAAHDAERAVDLAVVVAQAARADREPALLAIDRQRGEFDPVARPPAADRRPVPGLDRIATGGMDEVEQVWPDQHARHEQPQLADRRRGVDDEAL